MRRRLRYRRYVSADADSPAHDAEAPLGAAARIASIDVLRGFALLGIFIMNMPGFSHSVFAAPTPPTTVVDALAGTLRDTFFAGKFNLLFGLVFGIGFALQMKRLDAAAGPDSPTRIYARRLAFLFVVGLVHAMLLWSGDVLLIYAVLGLALLALRRLGDAPLLALVGACLAFPAVADVLRGTLFPGGFETVAAFEYQQFEASNDLEYGHGSFLDAVRETARIFDWSWRSPFGLFVYASFFVQMATGILTGFVVGRRGWPMRGFGDEALQRRAPWLALAFAIGCGLLESLGAFVGGGSGTFIATGARTLGRASLATCYALAVVRLVGGSAELPRWLRPLRDAGRMPLTNYLLQTALASFLFYGWGLGWWNAAGPAAETALAVVLFVAVQLPLSSAWMKRFRYGPLEGIWRRFTYGRPAA
jgi:uncharacterized protein